MLLTSTLLLDFVILFLSIVYLFHRYIAYKLTYWQRHGIYSPPTKPFVGNFLDCILQKTTAPFWLEKYYKQIDKDFFGLYIFDEKYFVPKDPELIKNILIRDHNYFLDRHIAAPKCHPIVANMLFMEKSPEWRQDRERLSVAYTTVKLKYMFPKILESVQELIKFLRKNQYIHDGKDLAAMYTADVISKCAFGINSLSFNETESDFNKHRRKMFETSYKNAFYLLLYFVKPDWVNRFNLEFMPPETMAYFKEAFLSSFNARTDKSRINDLIDIMKEIQKDNKNTTDVSDEIKFCSAAMQFFIGGFETSSTVLAFTFYEFAVNPKIQDQARAEIQTLLSKYGSITYDNINELQYLEACLKESYRKYPVLPYIDRKCNTDYPIPGTDCVIEKGTPLLIPTFGLHFDEKYWSNPNQYDPDRFLDSSIDNSNGIYYLPFGDGPRGCIGKRFGQITVKLVLAYVLANFKIEKSSKTPVPMVFKKKGVLLQSAYGIPLIFKEIDNNLV